MARNVILTVRDGDPACDRAREFIGRMVRELGLELEVRTLDPSSDAPLPQVLLWDGTRLERVADEAVLRDAIAAKIWSEDAAAGAAGGEHDARFAREETERNAERERFARARPRRKGVLREVRDEEPSTPAEGGPPRGEPDPEAAGGDEGRGSASRRVTPVLLRGGRRVRWDGVARVARRLRAGGGTPVLLAAFFVAAAVMLGTRDAPPDDPAPPSASPAVEAPPLELPTLDGFRFDLSREGGRAVLVVLFDGRKPNREGLVALGAEAEKALELSRGGARVVAIGVGAGVAELRAALPGMPFALAIAADADGAATRAFAAVAGQGAGWWLVGRAGRVVASGGRVGPDAFAALLASARGAGP